MTTEDQKRAEENTKMRKRSGNIESSDPLVSFLYELMRDHLPPGKVESIVRDSLHPETKFTNGWLASYAEDVATRLRRAAPPELTTFSSVTINGRLCELIPRAYIGYRTILSLAGLEDGVYSMTYKGKSAGYGDSELQGVIAPGDEVRLLKDMIINVSRTGNA